MRTRTVIIYKQKKIFEKGYAGWLITYAIVLNPTTVTTQSHEEIWIADRNEALETFLQNHNYSL